jgi:hypothetical protein
MSWVMSTCMACTGVVLESLNPTSLSGAPTRAMAPVGSNEVAILESLAAWFIERGGTRCEARTRMLLGGAMHGESTQALSGASSAAEYEAEARHRGFWCLVRRWYARGGRRNEQRTRCSEDRQTDQTVIARWSRNPASKRARVIHGTVLKRLVATHKIKDWENQTTFVATIQRALTQSEGW